jgi:hypothetical protein
MDEAANTPVRRGHGIDLTIWILVAIVIIAFAVVALPNMIGAQQKARAASVKGILRTLQIASESYATDSGGVYAKSFEALSHHLPGGSNTGVGGTPGEWNYPKPLELSPKEWELLRQGKSPTKLKLYQVVIVPRKIGCTIAVFDGQGHFAVQEAPEY